MKKKELQLVDKVKRWRSDFERILDQGDDRAKVEALSAFSKSMLDRMERISEDYAGRAEHMRLAYDVTQRMTHLLDPDELLYTIINLTAAHLNVERCSIMLRDEDGEHLRVTIGLGFDKPVEDIPPIPIGEGISGKVAVSGEPLLIKNIESDERFEKKPERSYKDDSLLCVPLKVEGRILGVINANNKKDGGSFTEADLELLTVLASAAAASIDNARLHRELQESWKYLNNVVHHINTGLLAVNRRSKITLMNRAFKKIFGLEDKVDVTGLSISEALPEPIGDCFAGMIERTWLEGDRRPFEAEIDTPAGESIPVEVCTLLLRDEKLQIQSQLVIVHDLSQSRELLKLKQLDTLKSNFVSTVSHELRTPLTSMLASVTLILKGFAGEISPEQNRLLEIVHRNAERLKALINDLLDLSRLESGRAQLNFEEVDLDALVQDCLSEISQLADEKCIVLESSLNLQGPVEIDPMKIQQVIINLFSNAIKFTPEGGQVMVETEEKDEEVSVKVRDTGCGIPADQLKNVFERFYQVEDTMTRTQQGTGLGLPICKRIVELHGGVIEVESVERKGCCFYFTLPRNRQIPLESVEEILSEPDEEVFG